MKPAVFLDRDGTINHDEKDYSIQRAEDFKFIPGALEALVKLSENDYLVVVLTNQSMVGRGFISSEKLQEIHDKLRVDVEKAGGRIDAVYYCPHHPDDGCGCRKPKAKMFMDAKQELDIDLSKSYMVGDTTGDILAGKNAGVSTILVSTGLAGKDNRYEVEADYKVRDLAEAAELIIKKK